MSCRAEAEEWGIPGKWIARRNLGGKKKKKKSVCLVTGEEAGVENFNKRAVEVGLN